MAVASAAAAAPEARPSPGLSHAGCVPRAYVLLRLAWRRTLRMLTWRPRHRRFLFMRRAGSYANLAVVGSPRRGPLRRVVSQASLCSSTAERLEERWLEESSETHECENEEAFEQEEEEEDDDDDEVPLGVTALSAAASAMACFYSTRAWYDNSTDSPAVLRLTGLVAVLVVTVLAAAAVVLAATSLAGAQADEQTTEVQVSVVVVEGGGAAGGGGERAPSAAAAVETTTTTTTTAAAERLSLPTRDEQGEREMMMMMMPRSSPPGPREEAQAAIECVSACRSALAGAESTSGAPEDALASPPDGGPALQHVLVFDLEGLGATEAFGEFWAGSFYADFLNIHAKNKNASSEPWASHPSDGGSSGEVFVRTVETLHPLAIPIKLPGLAMVIPTLKRQTAVVGDELGVLEKSKFTDIPYADALRVETVWLFVRSGPWVTRVDIFFRCVFLTEVLPVPRWIQRLAVSKTKAELATTYSKWRDAARRHLDARRAEAQPPGGLPGAALGPQGRETSLDPAEAARPSRDDEDDDDDQVAAAAAAAEDPRDAAAPLQRGGGSDDASSLLHRARPSAQGHHRRHDSSSSRLSRPRGSRRRRHPQQQQQQQKPPPPPPPPRSRAPTTSFGAACTRHDNEYSMLEDIFCFGRISDVSEPSPLSSSTHSQGGGGGGGGEASPLTDALRSAKSAPASIIAAAKPAMAAALRTSTRLLNTSSTTTSSTPTHEPSLPDSAAAAAAAAAAEAPPARAAVGQSEEQAGAATPPRVARGDDGETSQGLESPGQAAPEPPHEEEEEEEENDSGGDGEASADDSSEAAQGSKTRGEAPAGGSPAADRDVNASSAAAATHDEAKSPWPSDDHDDQPQQQTERGRPDGLHDDEDEDDGVVTST